MGASPPVKICVSVRWVTLWVRPPLPCENMCVRSLGYIVGASPPWENMCVRSLGYIVGASPPCENMCVRSLGYIVGVSPIMCVLSLENNLCWILACCLLRFAAFFLKNKGIH